MGLESFRLEDVEEYLGIYRSDQYSGRECIKVYLDYIVSKDPSLKERILLHNYEDLYYLLDVISILDEIEDLKSFKIYHMEETIKFNIEQIYFEKIIYLLMAILKITNWEMLNTLQMGIK